MPEWLFPLLSIAGSIGGAYVGVKIALARQEEKHAALTIRFTEHVAAANERLKSLGDRTHTHADRLTEHGMRLHEMNERVNRLERKLDTK